MRTRLKRCASELADEVSDMSAESFHRSTTLAESDLKARFAEALTINLTSWSPLRVG